MMTSDEIQARLPRGGQAAIARKTKRSAGHVSLVIKGYRRDVVVEREVARRLKRDMADVFAPWDPTVKGQSMVRLAVVGG